MAYKKNRGRLFPTFGKFHPQIGVYDPAVGDPDNGIAPGTSFADLPDDWVCPICGVGKDQFEPVE